MGPANKGEMNIHNSSSVDVGSVGSQGSQQLLNFGCGIADNMLFSEGELQEVLGFMSNGTCFCWLCGCSRPLMVNFACTWPCKCRYMAMYNNYSYIINSMFLFIDSQVLQLLQAAVTKAAIFWCCRSLRRTSPRCVGLGTAAFFACTRIAGG